MQRPKIGFLSFQDCLDRNSWSGTLFYMRDALIKRDMEVISLTKQIRFPQWNKLVNRIWKSKNSAKVKLSDYVSNYKSFASKVQSQLLQTPCDVIFAPVASAELFFLETSVPVIYLSDATFSLYHKYYNPSIDEQELEWKNKQESMAISKAVKLVYPSTWAANSAICDYHAEPTKIEVIPFGANLDNPPLTSQVLESKPILHCRLLFLGKDWHRKGGNIAFETLISLRKMGVDAELFVVGCVPPTEIKHDKLTVVPYLNKNIPQQREQLNQLFLKSHFLIFPTRADCLGIVICEANAFGLPVITTEVGGIPSIIKNGKNGYMLPFVASADDYAKLIVQIFSNKTSYDCLTRSSRAEYDIRLNWNKWAESLHHVIMSILN